MRNRTNTHVSRQLWPAILFWGALWGFAEATLGWGLHRLHVPSVSMMMFPVGLFCQWMAIGRTGSVRAAFGVAVVAAAIKLTDLFVLGPYPVWYVVNPAMHILLEGVATAAVFYAGTRLSRHASLYAGASIVIFAAALVGRTLFRSVMSEAVAFNPAAESFMTAESLAAALIFCAAEAFVAMTAFRFTSVAGSIASHQMRPAWPAAVLVAAVVMNIATFML